MSALFGDLQYDALGPKSGLVKPPASRLREIAKRLRENGWHLGTIIASETSTEGVTLRYCFFQPQDGTWLHVILYVDGAARRAPSLVPVYISADRHEREIEDLFAIEFSDHPRLGDFVLHDSKWAEGIGFMRPQTPGRVAQTRRDWKPHQVLEEDGAFIMPVGPILSGHAESALYLLETVGEDVVRAVPRLFYKYRAIEKLAQGRALDDVLLLVERCNGKSAFNNGWGYCNAVESALNIAVPPRGQALRSFVAELERIRHHAGAIRDICESTALAVAANQSAVCEELLLRLSGRVAGHRYLFGVLTIGGLSRDIDNGVLTQAVREIAPIAEDLAKIRHALERTSSFLDRIESVGIISPEKALEFELLGPTARASGMRVDFRKTHPYGMYESLSFDVPAEREGDGFARLRVLFAEIDQSVRLMKALEDAPAGAVCAPPVPPGQRSSALGWVEAPRGTSLHWVAIAEDSRVLRYHFASPSFRNWHGFHIATEDFAFQDFPIILATLDLSVAENDR